MSRIHKPINQVRLTNVAMVRLKYKGKRFEIACYKNKVLNWRNKVETDIDEVLQIMTVFTNVSKGIVAKNKDLQQVFDTTDQETICRFILDKGELQVSDKERQFSNESIYRDIATIIADKCVNPESNRPYPFSVIERSLKDIHFAPVQNRSAKQQALDAIKKLKAHLPLERAKMKILITVMSNGKEVKEQLEREHFDIIHQEWNKDSIQITCLIDPGFYRNALDILQKETKGSGKLDVIELNVQQEGEHTIDESVQHKASRNGETNAVSAPSPLPNSSQAQDQKKPSGLSCTTCGGNFGQDKQLHRQHFRSDWHRFNLKRKSKKLPIVDEDTFTKIDQEDLETFFEQIL